MYFPAVIAYIYMKRTHTHTHTQKAIITIIMHILSSMVY